MITNLDSAIEDLQKVRLPTEGEMQEYLNNRKKLADWNMEHQECQTKIANLQKYVVPLNIHINHNNIWLNGFLFQLFFFSFLVIVK